MTNATASPAARPGRMRRVAIWSIAVATVATFFVSAVVNPDAVIWGVVIAPGICSLAFVGALLADRARATRIGGMLMAAAALIVAGILVASYGIGCEAYPIACPGYAFAVQVNQFPWEYAIILVMVGVPLIFPTGHLISPRWRLIAWAAVFGVVGDTISRFFLPGQSGNGSGVNSFAQPALEPALQVVAIAATGALLVAFIGGAASVIVQFRRGSVVERQQTKWLLAAVGFAAVVFPLALLLPSGPLADFAFLIGLTSLSMLPVAIGVAVLRYRLYAIDRIVSRTISYAAITVVLVAVYSAVVVFLESILGDLAGGGSAEVVISTLIVASLFQPVRRRLQSVIDRRFDRHRYDADRMVAGFADRLRHEVQVDAVIGGLDDTVRRSMAPTSAGVWLRGDQDHAR